MLYSLFRNKTGETEIKFPEIKAEKAARNSSTWDG